MTKIGRKLKTSNPENMRKFVEALRSGRFTQGAGALEYVDTNGVTKNCCLGVACRVAMENGVKLTVYPSYRYTLHLMLSTLPKTAFDDGLRDPDAVEIVNVLPPTVKLWLGVKSDNPFLDNVARATEFNDTFGRDFQEIADAFERTYLTEESD
jgi:hypothetical protein